jgi:vacuolar-type H+-ATPase subunit E/Vma4
LEERKRLDQDDPIVIDLLQRVSRLEARVDGLEKTINTLKDKIDSIDGKTWYILTGILLAILIEILRWVVR